MKFGKVGQVTLVSAIALLVATLFTACGTLNVGFLFVPTNRQTPGQIEVYEVDSESGSLRTIPTSPFPSGGRDPIAEAVSINCENLYVVNQDDNNIVQFGIGTDGRNHPQSTGEHPALFRLAVACLAAHAAYTCGRHSGAHRWMHPDQSVPGQCLRLPYPAIPMRFPGIAAISATQTVCLFLLSSAVEPDRYHYCAHPDSVEHPGRRQHTLCDRL